jgi:hypothetical protein
MSIRQNIGQIRGRSDKCRSAKVGQTKSRSEKRSDKRLDKRLDKSPVRQKFSQTNDGQTNDSQTNVGQTKVSQTKFGCSDKSLSDKRRLDKCRSDKRSDKRSNKGSVRHEVSRTKGRSDMRSIGQISLSEERALLQIPKTHENVRQRWLFSSRGQLWKRSILYVDKIFGYCYCLVAVIHLTVTQSDRINRLQHYYRRKNKISILI